MIPWTGRVVEVDEAVVAVTNQLGGSRLDPESVLRAMMLALSKLRRVSWVATVMGKDPRTVLVVAADDDDPQLARYVEAMSPSGEAPNSSFSLRVIDTGEPVLVPRVAYEDFLSMQTPEVIDHLERNRLPLAGPIPSMGFAVVPMRTRGATIGTLAIFDRQSADPLTEFDVKWLQAIADRVAVVVENAQVHVAAEYRLGRIGALRNVALAIAGSRDLRLTLQVILDEAVAWLDVSAADVLVLDKADGMLRMVASTGFQTTSIPEYRLPVEEELPGRLLLGQSGSLDAAPVESRRRTLYAREGFRSRRVSPLLSHGLLTGVIEVFSRSQMQADQESIDFLEALASEAAVAIDIAGMLDGFERHPARPASESRTAPRDFNRLEAEILGFVVQGLSNPEIAERVHLSQHTIKFHVRRILKKVGAANRTELAGKATREGWL